ncbi:MAG: 4-hydroxy-tetrahydrodipicolinate reductase [Clostridia bacterium]|nr:4-hydroxy-tetrahydrodipicolinate reductase [Clostridia bacterium]
MKILLSGCNGRMGEAISRRLPAEHEIVAGVSRSGDQGRYTYPVYGSFDMVSEDYDVIIDFSVATNVTLVLEYAKAVKKPLVMGTTGLDAAQVDQVMALGKELPILFSHNTSFGVTVLLYLLEVASGLLSDGYDIELVEKHDRNKLDAPSGTSHLIVEALESGSKTAYDVVHGRSPNSAPRGKKELGIHSVRGGRLASEHYISFIGADEIIEINHIAQNFDIYGVGAVKGAVVLINRLPGVYSMKDVLNISI